MRRWFGVVAAIVALLVPAVAATAHVSVLPSSVVQGEAQEFTIRVPTERDLPTTAVTVEFPDEVTVYSFAEPPPGWTMRPLRAPDGSFRGVEYRGGEIGVARYADFTVLGTPFTAGTALWPARQTYADGRVKPWTGAPEQPGEAQPESGPTDPGPAAAVTVAEAGAAPAAATTVPAARASDDDGSADLWLGVIAIIISALAVLGVGLLWSTRPAKLPDDE